MSPSHEIERRHSASNFSKTVWCPGFSRSEGGHAKAWTPNRRERVRHFGEIFASLLGLLFFANVAMAQGEVVIIRDGTAAGAIVLSSGASPSEKHGAEELQNYLKQISGVQLPLLDDAQPLPEHCIIVGAGKQTDALGVKLDEKMSGPEDFVLRSVKGKLVILGGRQRGTMYGCDALLEKLGVRWLTPEVTIVPKQSTVKLPELNEQQHPAFEYREAYFTEAFDGPWAARLRCNGNGEALTKELGGKVTYHPFVHSFDELIPRSLFSSHPEYFPFIKGKRVDGYVQRCLSNPDVLKLAIQTVNQWMREDTNATIYSVSQNDTYNWCQCDKCQAIADKYGTQSGLYLWFVNQVAEAVEKEHPDKLIDTLAYQFTEAPPHDIVPRNNVRIRLCPISVCTAHPCEECTEKPAVEFMKNFSGWGKLTSTLYIWHYDTDFGHYLLPFPNFAEFPADLRLYQKSGVKGVFFEGAYGGGGGGSDAELRSYVMAKLLWNPYDKTDLVGEWMSGVYGPAANPMRQWFDLLQSNVRRTDRHFHISAPVKVYYLDDDTLQAGDKFFDEAERLAAGNAIASKYVAKSRLWLRYVGVSRSPGHEGLQKFLDDLAHFGIGSVSEGQTVKQWAAQMGKK